MSRDDDTLVRGLRTGDKASFVEAFERWHRPLLGYLRRLTSDPDTAADLLQETFLALARASAELRPDTSVKAWLFRVARNAWISHLRRTRVALSEYDEEVSAPSPAGTLDPAEHLYAVQETHRLVERSLQQLPVIYRDALLLAAQELEPCQAAAVVGIAPEAYRQRLHRARLLLAAAMERREVS